MVPLSSLGPQSSVLSTPKARTCPLSVCLRELGRPQPGTGAPKGEEQMNLRVRKVWPRDFGEGLPSQRRLVRILFPSWTQVGGWRTLAVPLPELPLESGHGAQRSAASGPQGAAGGRAAREPHARATKAAFMTQCPWAMPQICRPQVAAAARGAARAVPLAVERCPGEERREEAMGGGRVGGWGARQRGTGMGVGGGGECGGHLGSRKNVAAVGGGATHSGGPDKARGRAGVPGADLFLRETDASSAQRGGCCIEWKSRGLPRAPRVAPASLPAPPRRGFLAARVLLQRARQGGDLAKKRVCGSRGGVGGELGKVESGVSEARG